MTIRGLPNSWKDLQIKVADVLVKCGFSVEVEKTIDSVRGSVEIDVYAEENIKERKYSIICECKYWQTSIPQTIIHAFRTNVIDIGSNKGYIITTSKFQSGAKKASEKTNVELLTWKEFQNLFFHSWYSKYFFDVIQREISIDSEYSWVSWFDDLTKEDKKAYSNISNKLSEIYEIGGYFPMPYFIEMNSDLFSIPPLPLKDNLFDMDNYYGDIPDEILSEEYYQEFLDKFVVYCKGVIADFNELKDKYEKS